MSREFFTNITNPTTVARILAIEGLSNLDKDITGDDGYCFCAFQAPQHWCLAIVHKDKDGVVTQRIVTCDKRAGGRAMSQTFASITMELTAGREFFTARFVPANLN